MNTDTTQETETTKFLTSKHDWCKPVGKNIAAIHFLVLPVVIYSHGHCITTTETRTIQLKDKFGETTKHPNLFWSHSCYITLWTLSNNVLWIQTISCNSHGKFLNYSRFPEGTIFAKHYTNPLSVIFHMKSHASCREIQGLSNHVNFMEVAWKSFKLQPFSRRHYFCQTFWNNWNNWFLPNFTPTLSRPHSMHFTWWHMLLVEQFKGIPTMPISWKSHEICLNYSRFSEGTILPNFLEQNYKVCYQ